MFLDKYYRVDNRVRRAMIDVGGGMVAPPPLEPEEEGNTNPPSGGPPPVPPVTSPEDGYMWPGLENPTLAPPYFRARFPGCTSFSYHDNEYQGVNNPDGGNRRVPPLSYGRRNSAIAYAYRKNSGSGESIRNGCFILWRYEAAMPDDLLVFSWKMRLLTGGKFLGWINSPVNNQNFYEQEIYRPRLNDAFTGNIAIALYEYDLSEDRSLISAYKTPGTNILNKNKQYVHSAVNGIGPVAEYNLNFSDVRGSLIDGQWYCFHVRPGFVTTDLPDTVYALQLFDYYVPWKIGWNWVRYNLTPDNNPYWPVSKDDAQAVQYNHKSNAFSPTPLPGFATNQTGYFSNMVFCKAGSPGTFKSILGKTYFPPYTMFIWQCMGAGQFLLEDQNGTSFGTGSFAVGANWPLLQSQHMDFSGVNYPAAFKMECTADRDLMFHGVCMLVQSATVPSVLFNSGTLEPLLNVTFNNTDNCPDPVDGFGSVVPLDF